MSAKSKSSEKNLSLTTNLAYGLPAAVLAIFALSYYVYLPKFYTSELGANISLLGILVAGSRIFDAFLDPFIGSLSDKTKSRFGRRKPWIAFSALPLALLFLALAAPIPSLSSTGLSWWFGIFSFLFFLFWTAVAVPYEAWAPEITSDYDARTKLISFREGFILLGTVLAGAFYLGANRFFSDPSEKMFSLAILYAVLLFLALFFLLRVCKEKFSERVDGNSLSVSSIKSFFRNKPLRILLLSYFALGMGSALPATLILYYVEAVLGSGRGDLFLFLYLFFGLVFLPIWLKLSKNLEKRNALFLAMAINTGAFTGVLFLGQGDELVYGILVVISALGLGGTLVLPASMLADVIDVDELENGNRREGQISGLWTFARKVPAALGAGLGLFLLGLFGFQEGAGSAQPESALQALTLLYAGLPSLLNLLAIFILLRYSLSREEHQQILAELSSRNEKEKSS
jgi:GPH family glycoside/pentoside/hexuronide:cation symporter